MAFDKGTIIKREIKDIVPEAYLPFAAYVIQTRALPDARDCLKSGGRYILWSQYKNKNVSSKPRVKAADAVGQIMHWNPHGDAGIYGNLVRFAKPFAMRYLLEDAKGNVGTMTAGDDHTAARYLELRSSELADEFTSLVQKDAIKDWKWNYSQTDQYPSVMPTLFPNFVNGNSGIGVGCASSIPQFNLVEAIDKIKKLVYNEDIPFEEICIMPDFATGATIINQNAVIESLRTGTGAAICLRAKINYDAEDNCLYVTELPFQVFTNRIIGELDSLEEENALPGIKSYFDGTDMSSGKYGTKIVIELTKGANVEKVCRMLYKSTSLQSSFTVCQLMLENGITPKAFGLKEMMLAYLHHMKDCMRNAYQFDLNKVNHKITINQGYLIALARIEEIISIIKNSDSPDDAKVQLKHFGLTDEQSSAILELKLQRLCHMESVKIENDLKNYQLQAEEFSSILGDEIRFDEKVIEQLDRISKKYGDKRRTEVMNLELTEEEEPVEQKILSISVTKDHYFFAQEATTLIAQKRGVKGGKFKLAKNDSIVGTVTDEGNLCALIFTKRGKFFRINLSELPLDNLIAAGSLFDVDDGDSIFKIIICDKSVKDEFLAFVTKCGIIKKTNLKEYILRKKIVMAAIKLREEDELQNVFIDKNSRVGLLTKDSNWIIIETEKINETGRVSGGVCGIKLNDGDLLIDSIKIEEDEKALLFTGTDEQKEIALSDLKTATRATKGALIFKDKNTKAISVVARR